MSRRLTSIKFRVIAVIISGVLGFVLWLNSSHFITDVLFPTINTFSKVNFFADRGKINIFTGDFWFENAKIKFAKEKIFESEKVNGTFNLLALFDKKVSLTKLFVQNGELKIYCNKYNKWSVSSNVLDKSPKKISKNSNNLIIDVSNVEAINSKTTLIFQLGEKILSNNLSNVNFIMPKFTSDGTLKLNGTANFETNSLNGIINLNLDLRKNLVNNNKEVNINANLLNLMPNNKFEFNWQSVQNKNSLVIKEITLKQIAENNKTFSSSVKGEYKNKEKSVNLDIEKVFFSKELITILNVFYPQIPKDEIKEFSYCGNISAKNDVIVFDGELSGIYENFKSKTNFKVIHDLTFGINNSNLMLRELTLISDLGTINLIKKTNIAFGVEKSSFDIEFKSLDFKKLNKIPILKDNSLSLESGIADGNFKLKLSPSYQMDFSGNININNLQGTYQDKTFSIKKVNSDFSGKSRKNSYLFLDKIEMNFHNDKEKTATINAKELNLNPVEIKAKSLGCKILNVDFFDTVNIKILKDLKKYWISQKLFSTKVQTSGSYNISKKTVLLDKFNTELLDIDKNILTISSAKQNLKLGKGNILNLDFSLSISKLNDFLINKNIKLYGSNIVGNLKYKNSNFEAKFNSEKFSVKINEHQKNVITVNDIALKSNVSAKIDKNNFIDILKFNASISKQNLLSGNIEFETESNKDYFALKEAKFKFYDNKNSALVDGKLDFKRDYSQNINKILLSTSVLEIEKIYLIIESLFPKDMVAHKEKKALAVPTLDFGEIDSDISLNLEKIVLCKDVVLGLNGNINLHKNDFLFKKLNLGINNSEIFLDGSGKNVNDGILFNLLGNSVKPLELYPIFESILPNSQAGLKVLLNKSNFNFSYLWSNDEIKSKKSLNGETKLDLGSITFSEQSVDGILGRLILLPINVMFRFSNAIIEPSSHAENLISSSTFTPGALPDIYFDNGKVLVLFKDGVIDLKQCILNGNLVNQLSFNGEILADKKRTINIESRVNVAGLQFLMPITGTMDDPEANVAKLFTKSFLNFCKNIITFNVVGFYKQENSADNAILQLDQLPQPELVKNFKNIINYLWKSSD